jgi:hypothetical protein
MDALRSSALATGRLLLEPLEPGDADRLHAVWTSPDVRRFLFDDAVLTRAQTGALVARSIELFRTRGFGLARCVRRRTRS